MSHLVNESSIVVEMKYLESKGSVGDVLGSEEISALPESIKLALMAIMMTLGQSQMREESCSIDLGSGKFSCFEICALNISRQSEMYNVWIFAADVSANLITQFETIVLHHKQKKRWWKHTRHWTTSHTQARGFTASEIQAIQSTLQTHSHRTASERIDQVHSIIQNAIQENEAVRTAISNAIQVFKAKNAESSIDWALFESMIEQKRNQRQEIEAETINGFSSLLSLWKRRIQSD